MRLPCYVALLLVGTNGLAAEAERADWWSVDKQVVEELLTRDSGQWARELGKKPLPASGRELMLRFSVLNRAGHLRQVGPVIDALSDSKVEKSQLSSLADFLIGRRDWSTARYFLERLPQAEPGWGYVLIKEWSSTGNAKEIDTWLSERAKANPRYWLQERLRFRKDQGTAGELIEELAAQVRKRPQDAELALQFLEATSLLGQTDSDIAWIGKVCRPLSAYASLRLGKALRPSPRAQIALLEHSLEMPLTQEDIALLQREISHSAAIRATPTTQALEQQVRYATKQELLTALHSAGESARAQKLLEELAGMQPDGLPPQGFDALAGQVQAASGARVVQQKFQEAEPENQQSAAYWLRRAAYFTGRKEHAEAIAAYEKALEHSTPDSEKPLARSGGEALRSSVVSSYVHFLEHSDREKSAVPLLERELRQAPLDGSYAQRIMDAFLSVRQPIQSAVDGELLWLYLAARPQWRRTEERLLWHLVGRTDERPEKNWERAERLAADRDPSRAQVLGWVMTRSNASARAVPWLKSACQRLEKPDEREQAAFSLFGAYLDTWDWQSAETMWPVARQRLTPNEHSDWLGRIAVAAALAKEPTAALRLWKDCTNLDRSNTSHLDEMLRAGLREQLLLFYRSLAEQDPDCRSIEPVMQRIRTS